jgi:hypothetical protein
MAGNVPPMTIEERRILLKLVSLISLFRQPGLGEAGGFGIGNLGNAVEIDRVPLGLGNRRIDLRSLPDFLSHFTTENSKLFHGRIARYSFFFSNVPPGFRNVALQPLLVSSIT